MSSKIGNLGLVVHTNADQFCFVTEESWRQCNSFPAANEPSIKQATELKAAIARVASSILVNLDALDNLPAPSVKAPQTVVGNTTIAAGSIVLVEEGVAYVIPEAAWKDNELEDAGEAEVVVDRGAILAAVPRNPIPSGTFCVVVNLEGLK